MFDEPPHDPRDYPTAEAIEKARAFVFPEPLEGVTRHKEKEAVAAVLTMRNMIIRLAPPPLLSRGLETSWALYDLLLAVWIAKLGLTASQREQWDAAIVRIKQVFVGEGGVT